MSDLIALLEAAEGGSFELDMAVADAAKATDRSWSSWPYTTSLDAIVALIGEKLPGWTWGVGSDGQAAISSPPKGQYVVFGTVAKTASLALCAALLRAIKEGGDG